VFLTRRQRIIRVLIITLMNVMAIATSYLSIVRIKIPAIVVVRNARLMASLIRIRMTRR